MATNWRSSGRKVRTPSGSSSTATTAIATSSDIHPGGTIGESFFIGYQLVNRIGYLISTVPVPEGTDIEVRIALSS
ncbi:MAG: hypothetical protein JNK76_08550 [Planctomycetales bacterium]|nr:hypothetical protein [Planctomycetales bacterium]